MSDGPKIAILDIETYPASGTFWGLHKQFIAPNQVRDPGGMLGFGVKWHKSRKTEWFGLDSLERHDLALAAREYLHAADIVVTYNGERFDFPHINRELWLAELAPPAPYKSVDLYKTIRHKFRFLSNRLDFVSQSIEIGAKIKTEGQPLWDACMAGDEAAFKRMARYCKGDVNLTERLYDRALPWINPHPHLGLYAPESEFPRCGRCLSYDLKKDGFAHAQAWSYQRYECKSCGGSVRGVKVLHNAGETRNI